MLRLPSKVRHHVMRGQEAWPTSREASQLLPMFPAPIYPFRHLSCKLHVGFMLGSDLDSQTLVRVKTGQYRSTNRNLGYPASSVRVKCHSRRTRPRWCQHYALKILNCIIFARSRLNDLEMNRKRAMRASWDSFQEL